LSSIFDNAEILPNHTELIIFFVLFSFPPSLRPNGAMFLNRSPPPPHVQCTLVVDSQLSPDDDDMANLFKDKICLRKKNDTRQLCQQYDHLVIPTDKTEKSNTTTVTINITF
jgi:hypothetical protein